MICCHVLIFFFATLAISKSDDLPDFYTFTVQDIEGEEVSLEEYRGKVIGILLVKTDHCAYKLFITGFFGSQCC